jgi:hypothetical protein
MPNSIQSPKEVVMSSESVPSFTEDNLLEVLGLGLVGPDTKATCVGQTEENTRCQMASKEELE